jgi:hypothetical protein
MNPSLKGAVTKGGSVAGGDAGTGGTPSLEGAAAGGGRHRRGSGTGGAPSPVGVITREGAVTRGASATGGAPSPEEALSSGRRARPSGGGGGRAGIREELRGAAACVCVSEVPNDAVCRVRACDGVCMVGRPAH